MILKFFLPYVPYFALAIAIIAEVIGTSFIKETDHFRQWKPSLLVFFSFAIAFYGMSIAIEKIPLGVAYAIWAGLGIVLVTLVAVYKYKEIPDFVTLLGIGLIVVGVVIVNLKKVVAH